MCCVHFVWNFTDPFLGLYNPDIFVSLKFFYSKGIYSYKILRNTESLQLFTSYLLAFLNTVLFSSGCTFTYITFILLMSGAASAIASVNVEYGFGL